MQIKTSNIFILCGSGLMTFLPFAFEEFLKENSIYAVLFFGVCFFSAFILTVKDYFCENGIEFPRAQSKYISLDSALNKAWCRLEGTPLINGLQCLDLGEKYGDKRMYWLWREFIDKDKFNIELYGEREPSNNILKIDKSNIRLDGSTTYDFDNNKIKVKDSNHYYKNVKIIKKDLNRFIKNYKNA